MKKFVPFIFSFIFILAFSFLIQYPARMGCKAVSEPLLAIVIDDFGSYDQSGVETMLSIDAPLTCAVMPNVDNTAKNVQDIKDAKKELILHMPMEAMVNLPSSWYGQYYISNYESKEGVYDKLNKALKSVEGAKGFNIHIGSGACQNPDTMRYVYSFAKENGLFFLDSRTHINTICEKVANELNEVYLGRDEFLEVEGNRSYEAVFTHLMNAANMAKEKGYAIAIGHVGVHGGENTARAIKDFCAKCSKLGVKIVPLSQIYKEKGGV